MISVVTLARNKLDVTRRCLPSWLGFTGVEMDVVVVDNGSDDGTRDWLEGEFAPRAAKTGVEVRIIPHSENVGCSTARNEALDAARGEFVAFFDNDVHMRSRGLLAAFAAELGGDPRVAMVGPKLVYPTPPHDIQCAGVGVTRTGRVCFLGRGEPRTAPEFNEPRDVQCMISACCMARRAEVVAAGGFDEAFNPVQFEDFDLCYRLRERGQVLRYRPDQEIYHFESVTTQGTPGLANPEIVIRHGLLFKRRWRHRFEGEDGPPDSAARWRPLPPQPLEAIGALETL